MTCRRNSHPTNPATPPAVTEDRIFVTGGKMIASLSTEGRIQIAGEASTPLPQFGYTVHKPGERLLNALGALLAEDLARRHGTCTIEAW